MIAVITGSAGLIESEAARHFAGQGLDVVGIDNDMRSVFFGAEASTTWNRRRLERDLGLRYHHVEADVRNRQAVLDLFEHYGRSIALVVHTAAQPSHDWAVREPFTDFDVNANGTLTMLEATRQFAPEAPFIFTSTNKVYGDTPNLLPLVELPTRWEIEPGHDYECGIREDMSIDTCLHSLFGASKVAADVLVQEYGRYFDMRTVCFRGGTLTGPAHSATELHGFLGYVMRCAMTGTPYTVFGYEGKQVRDAIHSADLIAAFDRFFHEPRVGEVYNVGGGRTSNASVLEAIAIAQEIAGHEIEWSYSPEHRVGDHQWWIGSNARFQGHYPGWKVEHDVVQILTEIHDANVDRWKLALTAPRVGDVRDVVVDHEHARPPLDDPLALGRQPDDRVRVRDDLARRVVLLVQAGLSLGHAEDQALRDDALREDLVRAAGGRADDRDVAHPRTSRIRLTVTTHDSATWGPLKLRSSRTPNRVFSHATSTSFSATTTT